jgi:hypothetical protein
MSRNLFAPPKFKVQISGAIGWSRLEGACGQLPNGRIPHAQGGGSGGEGLESRRVHAGKTSRRAGRYAGGL